MNTANNPYQNKFQERRSASRRSAGHWKQRWRQWIDRRIPASRSIQLNHKNLFIFPSKAGFGFLFLLFLLLLVAINFENSAVYALVFLLAGVMAVSILHTFFNLAGITLTGLDADPTYAGRESVFFFRVNAGRRSHYGVQLSWQDLASERIDISAGEEQKLSLRYRTGPRGYCIPGRVKIESLYPLGLIRCWTWIDFEQQALVYPNPDRQAGAPKFDNAPRRSESAEELLKNQIRTGSEDFYGLRNYVAGDSVRNIAWKHFAKHEQLATRQFVDYQDNRLWLDWNQTTGSVEQRLQQLCHWALQLETGHNEYGLSLPEGEISPGRGSTHLHDVLSKLATYGLRRFEY